MIEDINSMLPKFIDDALPNVILVAVLILIIYITLGTILSIVNRRRTGRRSFKAWLPFFNIYLLGELALHSFFGFLLLIATLISLTTIKFNDAKTFINIIPESYQTIYNAVVSIILLICFLIVIFKLFKKHSKVINDVKGVGEPDPIVGPIVVPPVEVEPTPTIEEQPSVNDHEELVVQSEMYEQQNTEVLNVVGEAPFESDISTDQKGEIDEESLEDESLVQKEVAINEESIPDAIETNEVPVIEEEDNNN